MNVETLAEHGKPRIKGNRPRRNAHHAVDWRKYIWNGERLTADSPAVILTNSLDERIQQKLAESEFATPRTLSTLAFSYCPKVRQTVAGNVRTPVVTLFQLARDADADVRFQLAEGLHVPRCILEILTEDDDAWVACRAEQTLNQTD